MTEAAPPVISHCFTRLHVHRIEARIEPENLSSRRLAAKLGFTEVGSTPARSWCQAESERGQQAPTEGDHLASRRPSGASRFLSDSCRPVRSDQRGFTKVGVRPGTGIRYPPPELGPITVGVCPGV